jgi:hypothetical protein
MNVLVLPVKDEQPWAILDYAEFWIRVVDYLVVVTPFSKTYRDEVDMALNVGGLTVPKHVIMQPTSGLAEAYQVGIEFASCQLGPMDYVVLSDCGTWNYRNLEVAMAVRPGMDAYFGVRKESQRPLHKKFLTAGGQWYIRRKTRTCLVDPTCGYRAYRIGALLEHIEDLKDVEIPNRLYHAHLGILIERAGWTIFQFSCSHKSSLSSMRLEDVWDAFWFVQKGKLGNVRKTSG